MDEKELIQRNRRVISEVIEELRKVYDELTPLPELTKAREPQPLRDALTEIVNRGAGMENSMFDVHSYAEQCLIIAGNALLAEDK